MLPSCQVFLLQIDRMSRFPREWAYTVTHKLPKVKAYMGRLVTHYVIEDAIMELTDGLIEALIMETIEEIEPSTKSTKGLIEAVIMEIIKEIEPTTKFKEP